MIVVNAACTLEHDDLAWARTFTLVPWPDSCPQCHMPTTHYLRAPIPEKCYVSIVLAYPCGHCASPWTSLTVPKELYAAIVLAAATL